ncbi:MAG: hypothetical protein F4X92_11670 [Gammaproteobacteria bacterium]|nr:hypothetical protein [Gammaproteobacteria bacterium]
MDFQLSRAGIPIVDVVLDMLDVNDIADPHPQNASSTKFGKRHFWLCGFQTAVSDRSSNMRQIKFSYSQFGMKTLSWGFPVD